MLRNGRKKSRKSVGKRLGNGKAERGNEKLQKKPPKKGEERNVC